MLATPDFIVEPLDPAKHRREAFDCGVEALNDYLRTRAGQDMRRFASGCWVLTQGANPTRILGYYTLSPESVDALELPELPGTLGKKLPRYRRLGAILIGRLAVATESKGKGLGTHLLFDALHRCVHAEIPAVMVLVDPKDEGAIAFYGRHGFQRLNESRMFLPMVTLAESLGNPGSHR